MNVLCVVKCVVWFCLVMWVFVIVCIFIIVVVGENDDVVMMFWVFESVCNVVWEILVYY